MGEPTPRTADQLFGSILSRLTGLERRMGKTVLSARLGPVMSSDLTDFNDATETGTYWLAGDRLNSPDPTMDWHLEVLALSTGSVYQKASRIGLALGNYREVWTRRRNAGSLTWVPWSLLDRDTTAFTPATQTGVVLGNGTLTGRYEVMSGYLRGRIMFTFGSTSSMLNSDVIFKYPLPISNSLGVTNLDGAARLTQAGYTYDGVVIMNSTGIYVRTKEVQTGTALNFVSQRTITASTPQPWATGHRIELAFGYPLQP